MSDQPVLTSENLTIGYGRKEVLSGLSFTLRRGSFTALLGANGSGKSTLIRTILGIIPPLSGRLEFGSVDDHSLMLGYTPQKDALDPIFILSTFEVVLMGACGRVGPGRRIGRAERDQAQQCLCETGAEHLGKKPFSELSGGQKQRVLIARALATRPDFLLLDEPTSGIDTAARQAIMGVLERVHQQRSLTILVASHDLPIVRAYMKDVIWLHRGYVLKGPVREMLAPEKIEEILDLEMR